MIKIERYSIAYLVVPRQRVENMAFAIHPLNYRQMVEISSQPTPSRATCKQSPSSSACNITTTFPIHQIFSQKKRASHFCKALCLIWRRPTFPLGVAVSSARQGLTSLFEMVRGVHLLYNHQKYLKYLFNPYNITHIQEGNYSEVFG